MRPLGLLTFAMFVSGPLFGNKVMGQLKEYTMFNRKYGENEKEVTLQNLEKIIELINDEKLREVLEKVKEILKNETTFKCEPEKIKNNIERLLCAYAFSTDLVDQQTNIIALYWDGSKASVVVALVDSEVTGLPTGSFIVSVNRVKKGTTLDLDYDEANEELIKKTMEVGIGLFCVEDKMNNKIVKLCVPLFSYHEYLQYLIPTGR